MLATTFFIFGMFTKFEGMGVRNYENLGLKVCTYMKNALRIHLDTSQGLKPLIKK